jgi:ribonucleotide reductase beta subunit family protein with ferritin-like domain
MSALRDEPPRRTTFPISPRCLPIWKAYKYQVTKFWTVEEIDMSQDVRDWQTLAPDEREFLLHVLAFFAVSDSLVLENLVGNFCTELSNPEVVAFYTFQAMMENVHAEMYSILLDTLCQDQEQKQRLFNAVETMPSVAQKAAFAQKWMDPQQPYEQRLIAFACVEGILFSGSFCAIYWLRKRSLCPGLTLSNEFIARDEGMHCEFAVLLYRQYTRPEDRLPAAQVREIIHAALEVERAFIAKALPHKLTAMNSVSMSAYVYFVADRLCQQLCDHPLVEGIVPHNPFEWMVQLGLQGKTNFFEKRVSEYNKAGVLDDDEGQDAFDLDMEF